MIWKELNRLTGDVHPEDCILPKLGRVAEAGEPVMFWQTTNGTKPKPWCVRANVFDRVKFKCPEFENKLTENVAGETDIDLKHTCRRTQHYLAYPGTTIAKLNSIQLDLVL